MEISVVPCAEFKGASSESFIILPVCENDAMSAWHVAPVALTEKLDVLMQRNVFQAKSGEVLPLSLTDGQSPSVLALGLGARSKATAETLRRAAGKACAALARLRATDIVIDAAGLDPLPVEALAEGIVLAQFHFDTYKTPSPDAPPRAWVERLRFVVEDTACAKALETALRFSDVTCGNANWARDLACLPPNELTPKALADKARAMAKDSGLACEVLDEDHMRRLGMNALLGVAQGSEQRANLIVLQYKHPKATRTLALVGKGITFDTGGISIKPADHMHEMKYDMCGAAAVLGAMKSIAELAPCVNVVGVIPAVENMPGGNAQRPGDIVRACNGKTIEIRNTDAEGRLILADAMAYAAEHYKPDAMVDLATLTGAVVIALGHYAAGLLATDDAVAAAIERAAEATGERVWRLPLWDDYAKQTEGSYTDLCNIGPPKQAGTIMGAAFLKEFTGGVPWAHIDIAGTAYGVPAIPYLNDSLPTGYGVRLMARWVLDQAQ